LSDFDMARSHLELKGFFRQNASDHYIRYARELHNYTFSLFNWKFLIRNMPGHKRAFLEEIASDALQIMPIALMGFKKPTIILIRGILENTLRHVYFSDHPVEFERTNSAAKWYLNNEYLFEYIRAHPYYLDVEKRFDAINRMKTLYDELSAVIHSRKLSNLEMRKGLVDIEYDENTFRQLTSLVKRTSECCNFILCIYYRDKFNRIPIHFRSIITRTIPQEGRRVLAGIK
jgi:hypothetical protein